MAESEIIKSTVSASLLDAMTKDGFKVLDKPLLKNLSAFINAVAAKLTAGAEAAEAVAEHERLHRELNLVLHPNGDGPAAPSLCDLVTFVRADLKRLNAKVLEPQFIKTKGVYKQYPVGGSDHGWIGEYNRGRNDLIDQAGQTAEDIKKALIDKVAQVAANYPDDYLISKDDLIAAIDAAFQVESAEEHVQTLGLDIVEITSLGDAEPSFVLGGTPEFVKVNETTLNEVQGLVFAKRFVAIRTAPNPERLGSESLYRGLFDGFGIPWDGRVIVDFGGCSPHIIVKDERPFKIRINEVTLHDEYGRHFRDVFFQMWDYRLNGIFDPLEYFGSLFADYEIPLKDNIRIEFFNGAEAFDFKW